MGTQLVPTPGENPSGDSLVDDGTEFVEGLDDQLDDEQYEIPPDLLDGTEGQPTDGSSRPADGSAAAAPAKPGEGAPAGEGKAGAAGAPGAAGAAVVVAQPEWLKQGDDYKGFRADGQVLTIPGARVIDSHAVIPLQQMQTLERLAAAGVAHNGSFRARLDEARADGAKEALENNADIIKAKAFADALSELLDEGPDAVMAWLDDFEKNRKLLEARAERAQAAADVKRAEAIRTGKVRAPAEAVDLASEEVQTRAAEMAIANVPETVKEVVDAKFKDFGFTDDDLKQIAEMFKDDIARYYYIQPQDDPARGFVRGEVIANMAVMEKAIGRIAALRGKAAKDTSAAAEALAKNARRGVTPQRAKPNATGGEAVRRDGTAVELPAMEPPKTAAENDAFQALPVGVQTRLIEKWNTEGKM